MLLDIYELDTAALLTVVAVEEIDDPVLHEIQRRRTEQLATIIGRQARSEDVPDRSRQ